jgi:hypothetical protein
MVSPSNVDTVGRSDSRLRLDDCNRQPKLTIENRDALGPAMRGLARWDEPRVTCMALGGLDLPLNERVLGKGAYTQDST